MPGERDHPTLHPGSGVYSAFGDMKAWVQSADLSAHEFEADIHTALAKLRSHNWSDEERTRLKLKQQGKDNCPAGLGLVRDDGRILHICPLKESALVYFHHPARVLGFLWSRQRVLTQPSMPMQDIPALVQYFFERKDELLERIAFKQ